MSVISSKSYRAKGQVFRWSGVDWRCLLGLCLLLTLTGMARGEAVSKPATLVGSSFVTPVQEVSASKAHDRAAIRPSSAGRQLIRVGTSERSPLYIHDSPDDVSAGILRAMNEVQQEYRFALYNIPVKRRGVSVREGLVDIVMWDNPAWDWPMPMGVSLPLLRAKDIVIARRGEGVAEHYFDSLTNKSVAMVNGYTYSFPGALNARQQDLNFVMVNTEESTIKMLMAGRVDIALTSDTALNWFIKQNPAVEEQIVISTDKVLDFERLFLIPPASPISVDEINNIVLAADKQGLLSPVYERFGLDKPDFSTWHRKKSARHHAH
ncbi:amino acid ABC transporter substrate-binding protein [Aestuariicella hydrocarbonica]|uniref:Amino acid ABC transporter substrate-binding protein n=1 Tax=Pseudomaricurvus hydrocarbonicus TaxID=1470433 RepID=A0A9E5JRH4_9GAMM|nr:transporter substrate-binding domain-containing protein [Aestuariicella hydrocarbonica]NHO65189.1 amino acid ABC transporter substrate-binding protein [Aestuariicella hydrocarbonica]